MKNILKQLKAMGLSTLDITDYFTEMMESKHKTSLAFCIDSEALLIDKIISHELREHANLITLLHQRYYGSGKSRQKMAMELHSQRHDISFMTCRRRIDAWLNVAEAILYKPMSYAFDKKNQTFQLKSEHETV